MLAHSFWPFGQENHEVLELSWIRPDATKEYGVDRGHYRITVAELDAVNSRLAHLYHSVLAVSFNSHRLYHQER
jgi:hypothetical protein